MNMRSWSSMTNLYFFICILYIAEIIYKAHPAANTLSDVMSLTIFFN